MNEDLSYPVAKAAPPIAVSGLTFLHMPLSEWVYILTILYLLFQIAVIAPRVVRTVRDLKAKVFNE